MENKIADHKNQIIIYNSDDGQVKIEVRLEDENVWLTQNAMAELFDTTRNNITMHIKNIFEEGELEEIAVSKESLLTASDGKNYKTKLYNLDAIISVGYRVKSIRGTQFRIWANQLIREYLIKGYNLNVERFKNNGGGVYFEEVLEKIRDIRSSEKVFWRKILDIYATSIDYDSHSEITKEFFKTVQNKIKCIMLCMEILQQKLFIIYAETFDASRKRLFRNNGRRYKKVKIIGGNNETIIA